MIVKFSRWNRLRGLLGLLALLGSGAWAQGFDVQRWNPRVPVPALEARDLRGELWRLTDLRGKAVLINFWASWCEPCRAEMPSLQALAERQGPQKLVVLAVNFKESVPAATQFAQRSGLALPVLLDPQGAIARQWGVRIFPSTVLIDVDGRVRAVVRGGLDWGGTDAAALWQPLLETHR